MTRSKKIFLIIAAAFLIIVVLIAMDFSRKTTFPGKKAKQVTTGHLITVSIRR